MSDASLPLRSQPTWLHRFWRGCLNVLFLTSLKRRGNLLWAVCLLAYWYFIKLMAGLVYVLLLFHANPFLLTLKAKSAVPIIQALSDCRQAKGHFPATVAVGELMPYLPPGTIVADQVSYPEVAAIKPNPQPVHHDTIGVWDYYLDKAGKHYRLIRDLGPSPSVLQLEYDFDGIAGTWSFENGEDGTTQVVSLTP